MECLLFQGKQGPVEHIFGNLIFIYDRHYHENGGYICIRGRSCAALGGSRGSEVSFCALYVFCLYLNTLCPCYLLTLALSLMSESCSQSFF